MPYNENKEKLVLNLRLVGKMPMNPSLSLFYQIKGHYVRIGKTEVLDLNGDEEIAHFQQTPKIDFLFATHQNFKLVLNDGHRSKKEAIAQAEFRLSEIISIGASGIECDFCKLETHTKIPDLCKVGVKYTRLGGGNQIQYKIDLKAYLVKDIEWFSHSDPYLKIYRPGNDYVTETDEKKVPAGEWVEVVRTEHKEDNLNPNFNPFVIDGKKLCRGMENTVLKMEIWDKGQEGGDETIDTLISTGYFSLFSHLVPKKDIPTFDENGVLSGTIIIENFERRDLYSMIQHINYGLSLNLVTSIDFTASNGNPKNPSSLHFIDPSGKLNQYQNAIKQVFSVLEPYDTDKEIPVYGFGGMCPALGISTTSHCFPLTGDVDNPTVRGVDGVLDLYQTAMSQLKLSGPTNFSPTILKTIEQVEGPFKNGEYSYTILLIITDGSISDKNETFRAVERAAKLPISIIIIGVGDEKFEDMIVLDGENDKSKILEIKQPENSGDLEDLTDFNPVRDIVQFVPYIRYANDLEGLAREVLCEIPNQISEFYWMVTHRKNSILN